MIEHEVDMTGPDAPMEMQETDELIASDMIEGTPLYGAGDIKIGHVHNFMVNKRTGRVDHVLISDGGFLGLGASHYMRIGWNRLRYEHRLDGYVSDLTKEVMQSAGRPSAIDADMQIW